MSIFKLEVQVERFVDDHRPGLVACALLDAEGLRHQFIKKVPVVSEANLGLTACTPKQDFWGAS
jgi:hypothetical protein